eukprot:TRINITY_DN10160_c0_g1_i2.p1 TRINITY_DN10160_c0_g1~~TRINITY_DN10160_c0_g1_i2.p1  ORF type:complete len:211 (+),score=51.52 TRINITY_DN10160_c0_g1_i2:223-855(+)
MENDKKQSAHGETQIWGSRARPPNYKGSEGWQQRIYVPTIVAGMLGAGAVVVGSYSRGFTMVKHSSAVALNSALVTSCFCGAQELIREICALEPGDLRNSVGGGIVSGGLLGSIQGGRRRAIQCALLFAVVGTGLQCAIKKVQDFGAVDPASVTTATNSPKKEGRQWPEWSFPEWFPIQRLDKEAAAKKLQEREQHIRKTSEKLEKGEPL